MNIGKQFTVQVNELKVSIAGEENKTKEYPFKDMLFETRGENPNNTYTPKSLYVDNGVVKIIFEVTAKN